MKVMKPIRLKRSLVPLLCTVGLLSLSSALAWTPSLDLPTTEQVVDSAFNRGEAIDTVYTLNLAVNKTGEFVVAGAVAPYRPDPSKPDTNSKCLENWKKEPLNFEKFGSRPLSLIVGGQADIVFLAAQNARDNFDTPDPTDLIKGAQKVLPNGHIRVYLEMVGLPNEKARDAYNVALNVGASKPLRPYKINFLSDWKQEGKWWRGSMVYYFDLNSAKVDTQAILPLILQTGDKKDLGCTYQVAIDLNKFF
jgi:hypothetical protein